MLGVNFNAAVDTFGSPNDVEMMPVVITGSTGSIKGLVFPLWDKMKGLYGQCRIAAVKIRYIPIKPYNTSTSLAVGLGGPVNWWPLYAHFDNDGYEIAYNTWNGHKMLEEGNTRTLNMSRPWKIYKKAFKYKLNSRVPSRPPIGSGVTTSHQNMPGMWHGVGDCLSKTNGQYGCHIALTGDGFPPSYPGPSPPEYVSVLGTYVITLYVQYGDKL